MAVPPSPSIREAVDATLRLAAERLGLGAGSGDLAALLAAWRDVAPLASPAEVLGDAYEATLGGATRRARGAHYTPRPIARRVVDVALDAMSQEDPRTLRVIDPATGAGMFLCEVLDALVRRSGERDTPALRKALATGCVFGIDRDPVAVILARLALWLAVGDEASDPAAFDANVRVGDALLDGHGWSESFGRPFARPNPGFDLVVGNPPFLGGKRIRTVHGDAYASRLADLHPGASKNTDLAAHFLRRAYAHLREGGVVGFVTTNSIAQGDTRRGGLAAIEQAGATIVAAEAHVPWPGDAGVVTSLVWVKRGPHAGPRRLDGASVPHIDTFLSTHGVASDPRSLPSMRARAFIGCFLRGAGFVFDDRDPRANPLAEMRALLEANPASADVIAPFLGGEEIMNDPEHRPHRWVLAFGGRTIEEAQRYPDALALLERTVRPFREARRSTSADRAHRKYWWRFANHRPELASATTGLGHVLVIPRMSAEIACVRVPAGAVFSDQLVVVASASEGLLALLSSRVHACWATLMCSTLGDGLRYTPTTAFDTFPIPHGSLAGVEADVRLGQIGRDFVEQRATLLRSSGKGLSTLHRRFHDVADRASDITALRRSVEAIDRAVVDAYGWGDVALAYEVDPRGRIALSRAATAEVVGRLLALNLQIASSTSSTGCPRRLRSARSVDTSAREGFKIKKP